MTAQTAMPPTSLRPLAPARIDSGGQRPILAASTRQSRPLLAIASSSSGNSGLPSSSSSSGRPLIGIKASPSTSSTTAPLRLASSVSSTPSQLPSSTKTQASGISTSSSNTTSTSAEFNSASTLPKENEIKGTVQPKKEWILLARAKPGRKPSEVEPPTKRKAQNRASQRAFRERKQSYVASLEEKIEEYEKQGAAMSAELQKVARRLKEENELLRKENRKLKETVARLEGGGQPGTAVATSASVADSSEGTTMSRQSSQLPSPRYIGGRERSLDGHFGEAVEESSSVWRWSLGIEKDVVSVEDEGATSKVVPAMDRDCGFCTEQSPCVCRGEAVLDLTGDSPSSSSAGMTMTKIKQEEDDDPKWEEDTASVRSTQTSPSSLAKRSKLWYTVPMGPPPPVTVCPTEQRVRMPFRLGTSSNLLPPLQLTKGGKPKLWPVYTPIQPTAHDQSSANAGTVPVYRLRAQSLSKPNGKDRDAPACSGDPAHCSACSTDPALAAFCRAVASHLSSPRGQAMTPAILDAGNAVPLPAYHRKRSYSSTFLNGQPQSRSAVLLPRSSVAASPSAPSFGINLYTNKTTDPSPFLSSTSPSRPRFLSSLSESYRLRGQAAATTSKSSQQGRTLHSIPEAWKRIKQHPSFPQWQGGLDMLADVVSRRTSDHIPSSTESTTTSATATTGAPRVEIETSPSIATRFHRKSNDRSATSSSIDSVEGDREEKRRRLYVEEEGVEDALALLDRGQGQGSKVAACVCPLNRTM